MEFEEQIRKEIEKAGQSMRQSVEHLRDELSRLRAGKAAPQMLDGVTVDYYGALTPLNQLATINTPDAKTITIQPFDKSQIKEVTKAIEAANLGFNPQDDGSIIRINIPPLTEERRKELVRFTRNEAENARISIRNKRKEVNESIKKSVKEGLSEDASKLLEDEVQKYTDKHIREIDGILKAKEEEIMQV
jgi:ribosome recycling factor